MPFINFPAREINCKLVYYGPGLGGKTANLQWIYDNTGAGKKGKMISLATETDRTLFFDFLPLDLGTVRGFKTRLHLYTVPGQVFYEASRKLILKGADGVVFVADSQEERLDANLETLENLREHLQGTQAGFRHDSVRAATEQARSAQRSDQSRSCPSSCRSRASPSWRPWRFRAEAFSRRCAKWPSWFSRN